MYLWVHIFIVLVRYSVFIYHIKALKNINGDIFVLHSETGFMATFSWLLSELHVHVGVFEEL